MYGEYMDYEDAMWADFCAKEYELYMQQNCTCDRSDDCQCINFGQFQQELMDSFERDFVDSYQDCEF